MQYLMLGFLSGGVAEGRWSAQRILPRVNSSSPGFKKYGFQSASLCTCLLQWPAL